MAKLILWSFVHSWAQKARQCVFEPCRLARLPWTCFVSGSLLAAEVV
eukprot:CAMPEP_0116822066 /NCGR_PEP_ID=MMETSP0418-20121206/60_1 /TAXON_ID=1158023 /ORGANISM="Astrosyne radiata, Strain 13vi08-1A" /LENGTH=46 /DNA_ID= /DNA_START= /DNA_END= /DNA_ORIENTATION=